MTWQVVACQTLFASSNTRVPVLSSRYCLSRFLPLLFLHPFDRLFFLQLQLLRNTASNRVESRGKSGDGYEPGCCNKISREI